MKKSMLTLAGLLLVVTMNFACTRTVGGDTDSLTVEEEQSLVFMREEEKLAFDVYSKMYEKWNLMPFGNIRESEARHMEAVKNLLEKYHVADPSAGKTSGEFENPVFRQLYSELTTSGDSSEIQALLAGAAIEEIDIRDLKEQLLKTNAADIRTVFENLMRGSRNHLRAFVSNLAARGITYMPRYLSVAEYEAIINGPMERGGGNRQGH